MGDCYSLTAIEAGSRLFLSHQEGARDAETAEQLFQDVEQKRDPTLPLPVFTSDNWDAFAEGLLRLYSTLETPQYRGLGRPPKPRRVPLKGLRYARVCKIRQGGRIVAVVQEIVHGEEKDIYTTLGTTSGRVINTSYIERFNLSIRNALARFVRKGQNFSKKRRLHTDVLDFFQAWYNFVKPHRSLRQPTSHPHRKWAPHTPAMAAGLTNHVWSLEDLLTFKVPIQL